MTIAFDRLDSLLAAFPRLSVGLVGDLFLDRYLEIPAQAAELSIETGWEAYQVTAVRNSPGALGTVMNNLAALGVGRLVPVTVIGDDGHGYDLLRRLAELPVDVSRVLCDPQRLTPTYTKPMRHAPDGSWRELNRLDVRSRGPLTESATEQVIASLRQVFHEIDGLIVLDQIVDENCGVINAAVRAALADLSHARPEKLMLIDSRAHLGRFSFGAMKPNRAECLRATGRDDGDVTRAARELTARTGRPVYCTLGEQGILVARPSSEPTVVPAVPVTGPIDIVGAGDSVTAALVAALLAGATELEAAAIGNLAASITIQQLGTTGTATPRQVRQRWQESYPDAFERD